MHNEKMKLIRFGAIGNEKPDVILPKGLDASRQIIRFYKETNPS
tara:strand:- start:197 stop:328 length:132 start_codon:yes stop_codon:yes gene_type:complete